MFSSPIAFPCLETHFNVARTDRKNFVTALFVLRDPRVGPAAAQPLALLSKTTASQVSLKSAPSLVSHTDRRGTTVLTKLVKRQMIFRLLLSSTLMVLGQTLQPSNRRRMRFGME